MGVIEKHILQKFFYATRMSPNQVLKIGNRIIETGYGIISATSFPLSG